MPAHPQIVSSATSSGARAMLSDEDARALVSVAMGLAEDFGNPCAVVVLDADGDVRLAERSGQLPGPALASAIEAARAALAGLDATAVAVGSGAIALRDSVGLRGALGVSGGPEGFGLEACRQAGRALGLVSGPGA
jgi:uncharacterized protein GlcG (DUF336 family)